ncbi:hypothetical protein DMP23_41400 [Amycolatopsis sp. A1MSW2902]
MALVASDAPNATLGASHAPNATLGRSPGTRDKHDQPSQGSHPPNRTNLRSSRGTHTPRTPIRSQKHARRGLSRYSFQP